MRWQGNRESDNVEDLRQGGGRSRPGLPLGGGKLGIGGIVIALVASYFLGIDPATMLQTVSGDTPVGAQQPDPNAPPANDEQTRFVRTVLADTEDVWREVFAQGGAKYQDPKLVLFRGSVGTACGTGQSASGPFYCPGDHKLYIDLAFYDVLRSRLGAPGDFAQAYVIAHEVGHHVQNLLGTTAKLDAMRGRVSKAQYNAMSVRLELQADCYAGLWANRAQRARQIIEDGDIEEAMNAAAQIGDDALQGGNASPETFTHGTSAQRMRWFKRGMDSGDIAQCNTFDDKTAL